MTSYHAELTRDVDGIPLDLRPSDKHHYAWREAIYPKGTRLVVWRERQGRNTLVTVRSHGSWCVGPGECQWVERPGKSGITVEPIPTEKQIRDIGKRTLAAKRAVAQRRLAADVSLALGPALHDLKSVLSKAYDAKKVLISLYRQDIITLEDIDHAIALTERTKDEDDDE